MTLAVSQIQSNLEKANPSGTPAVLVTVVSTRGSTPREAGTRMLVFTDHFAGTIGGGNLEFQAISISRNQILNSGSNSMSRFPLGASLGQCCGGLVNLLFEPVDSSTRWLDEMPETPENLFRAVKANKTDQESDNDYFWFDGNQTKSNLPEKDQHDLKSRMIEMIRTNQSTQLVEVGIEKQLWYLEKQLEPEIELLLFGAGHVAESIVQVMQDLPVRVKLIDVRDELLAKEWPLNVEVISTDTPEAEIESATAESFVLIMTHDHGLDQRLCESVLHHGEFFWAGLIGSETKRRAFEKRLSRRGITESQFNQITCPIGIEGIRNKQPAAIAVSVVAQLLLLSEQRQQNNIKNNNSPAQLSVVEGA